MKILDFNYNEDSRSLYVEFSLDQDGDEYYRTIWLPAKDAIYYSPEIIREKDLYDVDEDFIIDLLNNYFEENEFPEEKTL